MRKTLFSLSLSLFLLFSIIPSYATVLIYAHRGGRGLWPEHSLIAYQNVLKLGVDFIDSDVNMTKDGVLVSTHNFALNPDITKNKHGKWISQKKVLIKSLTLKQLETYNVCQKKPGTKHARLYAHQKSYPMCHIPTMRQVINFVKSQAGNRVGFQIEVKTKPSHLNWTFSPKVLATALVKLLHQEKIVDVTQVQAFDFRVLYAIQKLDPKIQTAYLTQYDTKQKMLNPNPKIAALHTGGPLLKNYGGSFPRMVKALGGTLWEPQDTTLTKHALDEAHRLGLKVVVWTWPEKTGKVFDAALMKKFIQWGVDGIITDRPDKLRALMKKMHLKLPPKIPTKAPLPL